MVIIGGAICAAGVFIMALPTNWFLAAAESGFGQWLGHSYLGLEGAIHPYYIMTAFYLIVFSVGEAFYSPRVYEYAAAIAPKGQEASYGALAYLPFLVGKLLIGTAGWVLAAFVPETGPRRPELMWLTFALAASVAPIGLIVFRRYIRVPEAGRRGLAKFALERRRWRRTIPALNERLIELSTISGWPTNHHQCFLISPHELSDLSLALAIFCVSVAG